MKRYKLHYLPLWSGLLILLVSGACFTIRPVEPPDTVVSDWVSPTDYEILLGNLRTAVAQRNTQNYLRCFSRDLFGYQAAASLLNDNESVWNNWSLQDEQTWMDNVWARLTAPSGNTLLLEEVDLQDVTADSLKYVGNYTLRINHNDTTLTTLFQGQMLLVMGPNIYNEWEILRWADIETHPDSSWSHLKLQFSQ
ncbi:MAG: hypothetical protein SF053_21055 [Bacteroidia bacterium]|nr:hypothetical protein [Bacteroidia bacterium]